MKKIILGIIATISNLSFGQAILEHSYTSKSTNGSEKSLSCSFYASNGLNYYTYENISKTITVYNEDHTQIKSFILPMDVSSNLQRVFFVTDNLFNTNSNFEFLYYVAGPNYAGILLCDDDGVLLQTFVNRYWANLKKNSLGSYKLIVDDNTTTTQVKNIDIYSLTGTLSTEQEDIYFKNLSFAFPNPSNEIINISNKLSNNEISTLEIFNLEGKKISEKKVFNNNKSIQLDISTFSDGIYIYKLNEETGKFIKN